jgi:transcriptional regulator with XRE-family HTH domain
MEKTKVNILFGKYIAALRKSAGISQDELADRCHLDRTYIGTIERGEKSSTLNTVAKLAGGLRLTVGEVLGVFLGEKPGKPLRTYTFDLILNGVPLKTSDDMFRAEIRLPEKDHDRLLEAYAQYFWDDVDRVDLFRDYLPEMKERICALAEPFAVAKWGDKARRENGAWYDILPPETIAEEYYATDEYKSRTRDDEPLIP